MKSLLISVLLPSLAWSHVRQRFYQPSDATSGVESIEYWPSTPALSMNQFTGTLGSGSTITFSTAQAMAGAGLTQWLGTGGTTLFGGLVPSITVTTATGGLPTPTLNNCETDTSGNPDGVNNLLFTSKANSTCSVLLTAGTGVIGLTKVRFQPSNGQIVEADMQFDDQIFEFIGAAPNNLATTPKQIYLADVITHEMGHFFGLDHSSVRQATMLFAITENLHTTKTDDQMGIFSIYPPTNLASVAGTLRGSLTGTGNAPVFGAAVFALNYRTLQVNASEITDLNGAFQFCALPAGPQLVFAAPYRPYGLNIHQYYSGTGDGTTASNSSGCFNPGCKVMTTSLMNSWYSRNPKTGSGGLGFTAVNVPAGGNGQFVNVAGTTTATSLTAIPGGGTALALEDPRLSQLSTSNSPIAGSTANVGTQVYVFTAPASGEVQIRTAALQIYSRLQLNIQLLDSTGTFDLTSSNCPISAGNGQAFGSPDPSSQINNALDPWLQCTSLSSGTNYQVKITGMALTCADMPGNASDCTTSGLEAASTPIPYYILSVFDTTRLTDTTLSETLSTTSNAATTYAGLPTCGAKSSTIGTPGTTTTSTPSGGCCGTLATHIPGGPNGPASMALSLALNPLVWFALWWRRRKRSERRLATQ